MSDLQIDVSDIRKSPVITRQPTSRRQNERRGGIVAILIASLLASAGLRYWADVKREDAMPRHGQNATSLSGMDSFALGLLLGGLRGPLVMILWIDSENQKTDKNLEGVDTQIEWIRLLQPEFDTVHIFQIWNKAYNISVQMANRANKYDVILGAMDYAHQVDKAKPDDINIVNAIGQLFFDKYGNASPEKYYYRKRVRQETQPHPSHPKIALDAVLDSSFNVLPDLYKPLPGRERKVSDPADQEVDDGSELQYLPKYQPFPDGVSPFGMAFNYYKRAEVLQTVQKQQHAQLSDQVVDSRPALSLKFWAEEEMEQARRRELQAFGVPLKDNLDDDSLAIALLDFTASKPIGEAPKDPAALQLALADYSHAAVLVPDSLAEYRRHILNYPQQEHQVRGYMEEMAAEKELTDGDVLYIKAMSAGLTDRADLLNQADKHYKQCELLCYRMLLKYYITGDVVTPSFPPGFGFTQTPEHKGIDDLSWQQASDTVQQADKRKQESTNHYVNADRYEFDRFIHRSTVRRKVIATALSGE